MQQRRAAKSIDPLFLERWSPRAFDAQGMDEEDLLIMFEAARWAPSAYNYQPWRFVYALRGDDHWQGFLDLLVPFNRAWAQDASALVFVLSDEVMESGEGENAKPSRSHSLDTGAAWAQFALQATRLGYQARGMAGLDFNRSHGHLNAPERFRIELAVAVGRSADPDTLAADLRKQAFESDRRSVHEFAHAGGFPT